MTEHKSAWCYKCQQWTMHVRDVDRNLGCIDTLLILLTAGLWIIVLIFTRYIFAQNFHCVFCGS